MGVPQTNREAVGWYRKSAEQGDADAQYNLGSLIEEGRAVPQDYREAVSWWRKAAEPWQRHRRATVSSIKTECPR